MPIYNETKLECMYETNKLKMHTTGVPTFKKNFGEIKPEVNFTKVKY